MNDSIFQFDFKELKLTVSQIEEIIGYNEGDDREFVVSLIEEILKESETIVKVKAEYHVFNKISFNTFSKSIDVNNMNFNVKNIVFAHMKKSEYVALFLCTAGEEIGKRSREAMFGRDLLRGYIYDVIGSEIVETAADLLQIDLEKNAEVSGLKITNRYSPGYCGWDVAEQHKLFQLLPYNFCGIRLTESALMDPVKSVSGIIGIGANVKCNPYTCQMCEMKNCSYRKVKEKTQ